jgi:hypothetical protein
MTEKEILIQIARRLGVLIEDFTADNEITIQGYYDITVKFDDDGTVTEFNTHP